METGRPCVRGVLVSASEYLSESCKFEHHQFSGIVELFAVGA